MTKRINSNSLKLLLYKHFNNLIGPINLNVKSQVVKRIILEDETAKLIKNKMKEAWTAAKGHGDDGSIFDDFFNNTQCK